MEGFVQVYTGNGKGKTTAALGLALRAAGAGLKVYIGQFIKGMYYSEMDALEKLSDAIELEQYGRECFITRAPTEKDFELAREGLQKLKDALTSGKYNVVIADEILVAQFLDVIKLDDVMDIIKARPENVELVLTGRRANPEVVKAADLVTEMLDIKHYYNQSVAARTGIEK